MRRVSGLERASDKYFNVCQVKLLATMSDMPYQLRRLTFVGLRHNVYCIFLLLKGVRGAVCARDTLVDTLRENLACLAAQVYCESVYLIQIILGERSDGHGGKG